MPRGEEQSDAQIVGAINAIIAGLERAIGGFALLRDNLVEVPKVESITFNPRDPRNKYEVGGLEKLTDRGIEVCYRLFDRGLTRYAVAQAMGISFGAANYRHGAWQAAGGINRPKGTLK